MASDLDATSPQPAPSGAFCGAHPDRDASIVCARCGDFACVECAGPLPGTLCQACRARPDYAAPFPLDRDNWTFDAVTRRAWSVLKADFGANVLAMWAAYVPGFLLGSGPTAVVFLTNRKALSQLHIRIALQLAAAVTATLAAPFFLGVYAYCVALARGMRPTFGTLLSQRNRLLAYAPLALIQTLAMLPVTVLTPVASANPNLALSSAVRSLATSIPLSLWTWGIYLVIQLAALELVIDPASHSLEALRTSLRHFGVHPARVVGTMIGLGMVAFLSLSCCFLPGIIGVPFTTLAMTTMYLAMRTPPRHASAKAL